MWHEKISLFVAEIAKNDMFATFDELLEKIDKTMKMVLKKVVLIHISS